MKKKPIWLKKNNKRLFFVTFELQNDTMCQIEEEAGFGFSFSNSFNKDS